MKTFQVTSMTRQGKTSNIVFSSASEEDLKKTMKEKNLYLIDYREINPKEVLGKKLSVKSLVIFSRQLSTMIAAGIPIIQALDMLQSKADNKRSREIYRSIFEDVQKGNSLSDSMFAQRGAFPDLLTNMVRAGELGGTLDQSLSRMSTHFEKEAKLASKVKSASIYPAILGVVSVTVVLLLVTFVLPTITSMFDQSQMPWSTKIILGFSNFLLDNWLWLIIGLFFLVVGFRFALKISSVRIAVDRLKLRLPIFGKLNRTVYSARCARAFASLYSSGVQTLDMIETTGNVLNNAFLKTKFDNVLEGVSRGDLISQAIEQTNEFDPMLSSMIFIGEESGSLGDILSNTADYFDNEADSALQRMVSMIEPIMIIVLGLVIGFIVISIIQPIFTMYGSIG
ncbi:MAG: type II secretion system F family protein [Erysipelothrix sp.]|nr:type II secretion system F family protein [Erysipelothrix sp.]